MISQAPVFSLRNSLFYDALTPLERKLFIKLERSLGRDSQTIKRQQKIFDAVIHQAKNSPIFNYTIHLLLAAQLSSKTSDQTQEISPRIISQHVIIKQLQHYFLQQHPLPSPTAIEAIATTNPKFQQALNKIKSDQAEHTGYQQQLNHQEHSVAGLQPRMKRALSSFNHWRMRGKTPIIKAYEAINHFGAQNLATIQATAPITFANFVEQQTTITIQQQLATDRYALVFERPVKKDKTKSAIDFISLKHSIFWKLLDKNGKKHLQQFEEILQSGIIFLCSQEAQLQLDEIIIASQTDPILNKALHASLLSQTNIPAIAEITASLWPNKKNKKISNAQALQKTIIVQQKDLWTQLSVRIFAKLRLSSNPTPELDRQCKEFTKPIDDTELAYKNLANTITITLYSLLSKMIRLTWLSIKLLTYYMWKGRTLFIYYAYNKAKEMNQSAPTIAAATALVQHTLATAALATLPTTLAEQFSCKKQEELRITKHRTLLEKKLPARFSYLTQVNAQSIVAADTTPIRLIKKAILPENFQPTCEMVYEDNQTQNITTQTTIAATATQETVAEAHSIKTLHSIALSHQSEEKRRIKDDISLSYSLKIDGVSGANYHIDYSQYDYSRYDERYSFVTGITKKHNEIFKPVLLIDLCQQIKDFAEARGLTIYWVLLLRRHDKNPNQKMPPFLVLSPSKQILIESFSTLPDLRIETIDGIEQIEELTITVNSYSVKILPGKISINNFVASIFSTLILKFQQPDPAKNSEYRLDIPKRGDLFTLDQLLPALDIQTTQFSSRLRLQYYRRPDEDTCNIITSANNHRRGRVLLQLGNCNHYQLDLAELDEKTDETSVLAMVGAALPVLVTVASARTLFDVFFDNLPVLLKRIANPTATTTPAQELLAFCLNNFTDQLSSDTFAAIINSSKEFVIMEGVKRHNMILHPLIKRGNKFNFDPSNLRHYSRNLSSSKQLMNELKIKAFDGQVLFSIETSAANLESKENVARNLLTLSSLCVRETKQAHHLVKLFNRLSKIEFTQPTGQTINVLVLLFLNFQDNPAHFDHCSVEWFCPVLQNHLDWLAYVLPQYSNTVDAWLLHRLPQNPNTIDLCWHLLTELIQRYKSCGLYFNLKDLLAHYRSFISLDDPASVQFLYTYLHNTLPQQQIFYLEQLTHFTTYLQKQSNRALLSDTQRLHALQSIETWVKIGVTPEKIDQLLHDISRFHWCWLHPKQALVNLQINQAIAGDQDSIVFQPNAFKQFDTIKKQAYFRQPEHLLSYIDALFHRALTIANRHPQCNMSSKQLSHIYESLSTNNVQFQDPEARFALAEILGTFTNNTRFKKMVEQVFEHYPNLSGPFTQLEFECNLFAILTNKAKREALHDSCKTLTIEMRLLEEMPLGRVAATLLEMTDQHALLYRNIKEFCVTLHILAHKKISLAPLELNQILQESEDFLAAYEWCETRLGTQPELAKQFASQVELCRYYAICMGKKLYSNIVFLGGQVPEDERELHQQNQANSPIRREVLPNPPQLHGFVSKNKKLSALTQYILPLLIAEQHAALKRLQTGLKRPLIDGQDPKEKQLEKIQRAETHMAVLTNNYHFESEDRARMDIYKKIAVDVKQHIGEDNSYFLNQKKDLQTQYQNQSTKETLHQFLALCCAWLYQYENITVRPTQLLAVLHVLTHGDLNHQLLQMDTGEGKTLVMLLYSLVKAFQGNNVEIYANTIYMASHELGPKIKSLASALGFGVGCPYVDGPSAYEKQIVIVDAKTDIINQMHAKYRQAGPCFFGEGSKIQNVNIDDHGIRKKQVLIFDENDTALDQLSSSVVVCQGAPYPEAVQTAYQNYWIISNLVFVLMRLIQANPTAQTAEENLAENHELYQQLIDRLCNQKPHFRFSEQDQSYVQDWFDACLKTIQPQRQMTIDRQDQKKLLQLQNCARLFAQLTPEKIDQAANLNQTLTPAQKNLDFNSACTAFSFQRGIDYELYETDKSPSNNSTAVPSNAEPVGNCFELNIILQPTSGDRDSGILANGVHQRLALLEQALTFQHNPKDQILVPPLNNQLAQATVASQVAEFSEVLGLTGTQGNPAQRDMLNQIFSKDNQLPEMTVMQRFETNARHDFLPLIFEDTPQLYQALLEDMRRNRSLKDKRPELYVFTTEADLNDFREFLSCETNGSDPIVPILLNVTGKGSVEPQTVYDASQPGAISLATAIAARGIDHTDMARVKYIHLNHEKPFDYRQEIQAIGRCGRNGNPGESYVYSTKAALGLDQPLPAHSPLSARQLLADIQTTASNRIAKQAKLKYEKEQIVQQFQCLYLQVRNAARSQLTTAAELAKLENTWELFFNTELLPLLANVNGPQIGLSEKLTDLLKTLYIKFGLAVPETENLFPSIFAELPATPISTNTSYHRLVELLTQWKTMMTKEEATPKGLFQACSFIRCNAALTNRTIDKLIDAINNKTVFFSKEEIEILTTGQLAVILKKHEALIPATVKQQIAEAHQLPLFIYEIDDKPQQASCSIGNI